MASPGFFARWVRRSAYYGGLPWRDWFCASAHDSDSFFWRLMGLEISIRRKPKETTWQPKN